MEAVEGAREKEREVARDKESVRRGKGGGGFFGALTGKKSWAKEGSVGGRGIKGPSGPRGRGSPGRTLIAVGGVGGGLRRATHRRRRGTAPGVASRSDL